MALSAPPFIIDFNYSDVFSNLDIWILIKTNTPLGLYMLSHWCNSRLRLNCMDDYDWNKLHRYIVYILRYESDDTFL